MENKKKSLFYSDMYKKCSPRSINTTEFEECCKDEADSIIKKVDSLNHLIGHLEKKESPPLDTSERIMDKVLDKDDGFKYIRKNKDKQ